MQLAVFDETGKPVSFRPAHLPVDDGREWVPISDEVYTDLLKNQRTKRFVDGQVVEIERPRRNGRNIDKMIAANPLVSALVEVLEAEGLGVREALRAKLGEERS